MGDNARWKKESKMRGEKSVIRERQTGDRSGKVITGAEKYNGMPADRYVNEGVRGLTCPRRLN